MHTKTHRPHHVSRARRLRERWPALPILFMSGYSVEDVLRQGAIGFEEVMIQKPFTPSELLRSVTAALSQEVRWQAGKRGVFIDVMGSCGYICGLCRLSISSSGTAGKTS